MEKEESKYGRLGFLLTEEDTEKLMEVCQDRDMQPYRLISEAIGTFHRVVRGEFPGV